MGNADESVHDCQTFHLYRSQTFVTSVGISAVMQKPSSIDLLFMHGRYSTYEAWPQSITKTSSNVDDDNDRCSADKDVQGMPTQTRFVSLMERNGPALQLSYTHGRIHPQLCARPSMASWRDMGGYVMRCLLQ